MLTARKAFGTTRSWLRWAGRQIEASEHVTMFRDAEADETYQGVVQDVEQGYSKSVAFLLPDGPVRPPPLYRPDHPGDRIGDVVKHPRGLTARCDTRNVGVSAGAIGGRPFIGHSPDLRSA